MGSIINGTTKSRKEVLLALTQVLTTNNDNSSISEKDSSTAIEDATIEVSFKIGKKYRSRRPGLMLTEDGIFITTAPLNKQHEVKGLPNESYIRWRKRNYTVEEMICSNPLIGLAIYYANVNGPCRALKYKTHPSRFSYLHMPVVIISKNKDKTHKQIGEVIETRSAVTIACEGTILEGIQTNVKTPPGFCAGPVLYTHRLIGLCAFEKLNLHDKCDNIGYLPTESMELCLFEAYQTIGKKIGIR